jgi:hypothetical protein
MEEFDRVNRLLSEMVCRSGKRHLTDLSTELPYIPSQFRLRTLVFLFLLAGQVLTFWHLKF